MRQLFEAHLRGRPDHERAKLLSGAAELARPVVLTSAADDDARDAHQDQAFAITHGLYWLTANLAEDSPLLVAVDDTQWSDLVSLRFLVHLRRRLTGMRVLLAVSIRIGEAGPAENLLAQMTSEPETWIVRPSPLSERAVTEILGHTVGHEPHPVFGAACAQATGGVPFFVGELALTLRAHGIAPSAANANRVAEIVPEAAGRAIVARVQRAGPATTELARAVAVLGADAQLPRAAELAGLSEPDAVDAADALEAMNILQSGRPLQFVHPVVREAIYGEIASAAGAAAHARAAELLVAQRAEPDAVAAHLLLASPAARRETVERLGQAADHALTRGAPESAATYLQRALEEGGLDPDERAALVHRIGQAERQYDAPAAIATMREARELATDPVTRARVAYDLGETLFYRSAWLEVLPLVDSALAELGDADHALAVRLEALRAACEFHQADRLVALLRRLPRLRELARAGIAEARPIAALLAGVGAWTGSPNEEIDEMLELAMPGGTLGVEDPESWVVQHLLQPFGLRDELDRLMDLCEQLFAEARRKGSRGGIALAFAHRGWAHERAGDLAASEADCRAAVKLMWEHDLGVGQNVLAWYFLDTVVERPGLQEETERLLALVDDDPPTETLLEPLVFGIRGWVRLHRGDVSGAIEDLRRCGSTVYAYGNPNGWRWRPALATALAATDPDEARELAEAEVEAARRYGQPRAIGVALRTRGLAIPGEQGFADLDEAVRVLADSPCRLEHARALVELGAARRRAGHRTDAREPLREGLDLAHRCGATRLQERARQELLATGARPRRAMLTGRDALTATEQRIAGMAAEGMSNPEIAQALFVTRKTVENHLSRIYPKLGINSREQLPRALEP